MQAVIFFTQFANGGFMVAIRHSHELNPANFELASWSASLEMSPITFAQLQSAWRYAQEKLDIEQCKASIKKAGEFFSEYPNFDCLSWLLSPNILPLLDEDSNIRTFQSMFDIKYINYDFEQATQRVMGEYAYSKKSSLTVRLHEYLQKHGDPGMGYGIIKNEGVAG